MDPFKLAVFLVALCLSAGAGAALPPYSVTPYQYGGADSSVLLNARGQMAGWGYRFDPATGNYMPRGFLLSPGAAVDLGPGVVPTALNNRGQLVYRPFTADGVAPSAHLYQDGQVLDLGTLGGHGALAAGINDAGDVVGYARAGGPDYQAFLYRHGRMRALDINPGRPSGAFDINERGQIVGEYVDAQRRKRAFLHDERGFRDLGTLGGAAASATRIGNAGHVLGVSEDASGAMHDFVYRDGAMAALPDVGGARFRALDINSAGQVISDSYLWSAGTLTPAQQLADPALGWYISRLYALNDAGQIAAHGCISAGTCALVLLTPLPEPGALALYLVGGAVLAFVLRRRARRRIGPRRYLRMHLRMHLRIRLRMRLRRVPAALLAVLAAATGPALALPLNSYQVAPLTGPPGYGYSVGGLNDRGELAVTLSPPGGNPHAYLQRGAGLTDLGTLGGWSSSARALNNNGAVLGAADAPVSGAPRAFLYQNGSMRDLGTLGGESAFPVAINDAGQVIGQSTLAGGQERAFLYADGRMIALGSLAAHTDQSTAVDINAAGQVTGIWIDAYGWSRTFIYQDGRMRDLGTLGGITATPAAINDRGEIVGTSQTQGGADLTFLAVNNQLRAISPLPGDARSRARDINNRGEIIGISDGRDPLSRPFLWREGFLFDLNEHLITDDPTLRLTDVAAINNGGAILGSACAAAGCFQVLLTPVPEPGGAALLAVGFGVLLALRRRLSAA